jgi:hypothetical protein
VLPAGTVASPYVPDEQMPYLRQPDGTFKLWASAGGTYGTYLFATPDLLSLAAPATVFAPPARERRLSMRTMPARAASFRPRTGPIC